MFENMNEEWRDKWVAALRSGQYTQGVGSLTGPEDTYCCLGVLCNIFDSAGWESNEPGSAYVYDYNDNHDQSHFDDEAVDYSDHSEYWDETHSETELPGSLAALLKVNHDDEQTLISFNDGVQGAHNPLGVHLTFSEIADIIEYGVLPNKAIA